jgi:hypothetical protein
METGTPDPFDDSGGQGSSGFGGVIVPVKRRPAQMVYGASLMKGFPAAARADQASTEFSR